MLPDKKYDAFLSHNSRDKPLVEKIGNWLIDEAGLTVFLDRWNLVPGNPWQEALEQALDDSRCCIVFIGPTKIGPWQNEEMRASLDDRVSNNTIRVVPVLLPGARKIEKESELPRFLRRLTWVEFKENVEEEDPLSRIVCGIKGLPPGRATTSSLNIISNVCPFRGLEVFREEDAPFFFGREAVIQRLKEHLEQYHFLVVMGPSGSGKSSVVRAGLIAEMRQKHPHIAVVRPGTHPLEELAIALNKIKPKEASEAILKRLQASDDALYFITREILHASATQTDAQILLVIDQFEEIFTQTSKEEERSQFISLLLKSQEKKESQLSLIITMRSDFVGKCAPYPDLNIFINDHTLQIGPMSRGELRMTIEEPAQLAGLTFEGGLVEQILNDVEGASGELPLMEYALLELYKRREGNKLTLDAYQTIGGVEGALVKRAEEEYEKLNERQKDILRNMFVMRLVHPGEGTEDTRRRAAKQELLNIGGDTREAEAVIHQWTDARMLTSSHDDQRNTEIIDVAHEALIRRWHKIREWMDQDREKALLMGRIHKDAEEWQKANRHPDYLYSGVRLLQAQELAGNQGDLLTPQEQNFIKAADDLALEKEREKEAQREEKLKTAEALASSRKKSNRILISFIILLFLTLGVTAYFFAQNRESNKKIRGQLMSNYWRNANVALEKSDQITALHFINAAIKYSNDTIIINNLKVSARNLIPQHFIHNIKISKSAIDGAAFSNDGKQVLIWGHDGAVRLWQENEDSARIIAQFSSYGLKGAGFSSDDEQILILVNEVTRGLVWLWQENEDSARVIAQFPYSEVIDAIFSNDNKQVLAWGKDGTVWLWQENGDSARVIANFQIADGVLFSSDNQQMVAWGQDSTGGSVQLWNENLDSARVIAKFPFSVFDVVFSNDDQQVLAWGEDGSVQLWQENLDSAIVISKFPFSEYVYGAKFNSDQQVLIWGSDGTVRQWEEGLDSAKVVVKFPATLIGTVFSSDDQQVVAWGNDGTVWLWRENMDSAQVIAKFSHAGGAVFSDDDQQVLIWGSDGSGGTVRLWRENMDSARVIVSSSHDAILSSDRKQVLTWGYDGKVRLWQANRDSVRVIVQFPSNEVNGAVFSSDDQKVLVWGGNGIIRLWQENEDSARVIAKFSSSPTGTVFSSDDQQVLAWGGEKEGGSVRLWQENEDSARVIAKFSSSVNNAVFSSDNKRVLTWGREREGGSIRLWQENTDSARVIVSFRPYGVNGAVSSSNDKQVLAWGMDGTGGTLWLWQENEDSARVIAKFHSYEVNGAIFSSDDQQVLAWGNDDEDEDDGTVWLWQENTDSTRVLGKFSSSVNNAVFSSDDQQVLAWGEDGTVLLWEKSLESARIIAKFPSNGVNGAIFSSDSKQVLAWGEEDDGGTVRLWQENEDSARVLGKFSSSVNNAVFSSDDKQVLAWGNDGAVRLWNANAGAQTGKLLQHGRSLQQATFSKNLQQIFTWGNDGIIKFWDTKTGLQIGEFLLSHNFLNGAMLNATNDKILCQGRDNRAESSVKLWDLGTDLDLPNSVFDLQVKSLTATLMDSVSNEITYIEYENWKPLFDRYHKEGREHFKHCRYQQYNIWRTYFPEEAEEILREKAPIAVRN